MIAKSGEAHQRLEGGEGKVFYDKTRPLGELLLSFESDSGKNWNQNASWLFESYRKGMLFEEERWKLTEKPCEFLREKYKIGELSAMFAAIRTWEEYLNCYNLSHGPQRFIDNMSILYRPFSLYCEYRPWQDEAENALSKALHDGESQVELWYPLKKRGDEAVAAFASFQPVIFYYLHKIEEWSLLFQECKVCSHFFLAKNKHYEICGERCRKEQAVEAKRKFEERARGDRLEQLHESAYYYWYNRLRKLKRAKSQDIEKIATITSAFAAFRQEAVRQKTEVKNGSLALADFTTWLADQQNEVDRLMEEK